MMKKTRINYILVILLILLSLNVIYFFQIRKKKKIEYDFINNLKHIELNHFKSINSVNNSNSVINLIYIFQLSDCDACVFNMFKSIDVFSNIDDHSINVILVYDNINEAEQYCNQFYSEYYPNVNFYFASYNQFNELKIETPFLLAEQKGKVIFNFNFGMDINLLWKLTDKHFHN